MVNFCRPTVDQASSPATVHHLAHPAVGRVRHHVHHARASVGPSVHTVNACGKGPALPGQPGGLPLLPAGRLTRIASVQKAIWASGGTKGVMALAAAVAGSAAVYAAVPLDGSHFASSPGTALASGMPAATTQFAGTAQPAGPGPSAPAIYKPMSEVSPEILGVPGRQRSFARFEPLQQGQVPRSGSIVPARLPVPVPEPASAAMFLLYAAVTLLVRFPPQSLIQATALAR